MNDRTLHSRFLHSVSYLESLLTLEPERRFGKLEASTGAGPIGLRRCQWLLERLDISLTRTQWVHVTGTSGKGSVVTMLQSILLEAGYRVGAYLSPHVSSPLERILIDGHPISESLWLDVLARIQPHIERGYLEGEYGMPSFHEILFAMALLAFEQTGVALGVLEVGIGGTLDSTNVIPAPLLAIITDVGLDHTEILGTDVATIAWDKSGIIKPGCVALSGVRRAEALASLSRRVDEVGVPFYQLEQEVIPVANCGGGFSVRLGKETCSDLRVLLPGAHQERNALLAAAGAMLLRKQGLSIDEVAIRAGVANAFLPGRFEVLPRAEGDLVLDIAHNVDKMSRCAESFAERYGRQGSAVVAISKGKDVDGILHALSRHIRRLVVTRPVTTPRPMVGPRALYQSALPLFDEVRVALDPHRALEMAGSGPVLVTGSAYLVGEVRAWLLGPDPSLF